MNPSICAISKWKYLLLLKLQCMINYVEDIVVFLDKNVFNAQVTVAEQPLNKK